jgi:hypothetical protein
MRSLAIFVAALALSAAVERPASAEEKVRLAQSSTVTNCMMSCNAQAATCQTACLVPGTPPTASATLTSNATAGTACVLGCNAAQLSCQTNCARQSPSQ